jgi:hypothetical protein
VPDDTSEYRVPKDPVEVDLQIEGGVRMRGSVFVSQQAESHPGRERVLDLLNKAGRAYLPIESETETRLVHKDRIVLIRTLDERDCRLTLDEPGEHPEIPVRLCLAGGASAGTAGSIAMDGNVIVEGPPERRRLLDYLNEAPRFFPLVREDGVYLVNQSFVVHLCSSGG